MNFARTKLFIKLYGKLHPTTRKKVDKQLGYLAQGIQHPSLNARKMAGYEDIWEVRIDEHYRMTFEVQGSVIMLRKVGTHEIYRNP